MKIKCIIIEDEPLAAEKLTGFIHEHKLLDLVGNFDNAMDAMACLKEIPVDLIFLDIHMKGFNGIQFLENVQPRPNVIITSAYDQYALKCYEYSVDDYLLKPYSFERFVKAVDKTAGKIAQNTEHGNHAKEFIFVNTEYRLERIDLKNILYIEGMKDYLKIVTTEKNILTLQNFKKILDILPPHLFIRTHKSYIVSVNKIVSIEKSRIRIGGSLIPISDGYKDNFYHLIDKLNNI